MRKRTKRAARDGSRLWAVYRSEDVFDKNPSDKFLALVAATSGGEAIEHVEKRLKLPRRGRNDEFTYADEAREESPGVFVNTSTGRVIPVTR